jgi:hypothetical protein
MFESSVLRKTFWSKRHEMTVEWRRLHKEELYDQYSSPNIIRLIKSRTRLADHVACMGDKRSANRVLVGRPEGKRPLERPRCRRKYNIKVDLQAVGWGGMDWIDLARDRNWWRALVNEVMNIRDPQNEGNFLTS